MNPPTIESPSIWPQDKWKQFYPENLSQTDRQRFQNCFLHYCIATNKPDEFIIRIIESEKSKDNKFTKLTFPDSGCYQLTPLHIAAMKGRKVVVQALLNSFQNNIQAKQKSLDAKDQFGWTPLHHAALTSEDVYKTLEDHGAFNRAKSTIGATPENLKHLTGRVLDQRTAPRVFLSTPGKSLTPISEISPAMLRESYRLANV